MVDNIVALINYVSKKCREKGVKLDVTVSGDVVDDDILTFRLEKQSKNIIVNYYFRDVTSSINLIKYIEEMDINIKNLDRLIKEDYIC